MKDDILIKAEGVGKKFCRSLKKSLFYGIQDVGYDILGLNRSQSELRKEEFWANKDISFELRRGECLGLIGKNGAGKTTLLKMLNGLIKPDAGTIEMRGRVGAMIALGAGFNPILTGRENVYIAASVLGFSKQEVDKRFDGIVDFSDIGEFIDTPVQSYSSGMKVRLGFAVASSLDPDILLIDEVLAVGDVGFRTKCYNRIYEVCKNAAVIFVSHNMPQIDRLCDRVMVLTRGKEVFCGGTYKAIDQYNRLFESDVKEKNETISEEIRDITVVVNDDNKKTLEICGGDTINVKIKGKSDIVYENVEVALSISQPTGDLLLQTNSKRLGKTIPLNNEFQIEVRLEGVLLGSGSKNLAMRILCAKTSKILYWNSELCLLHVTNKPYEPTPIFAKGVYLFHK